MVGGTRDLTTEEVRGTSERVRGGRGRRAPAPAYGSSLRLRPSAPPAFRRRAKAARTDPLLSSVRVPPPASGTSEGPMHEDKSLSGSVLGAAICVHRLLGPGLLESAYETSLQRELLLRGIRARRQVPLSFRYRGAELECAFRVDLLVEDTLIVEVKSVEALLPVHEAQLLTYLRLSGKEVGLLINFNIPRLKDGIRRRVVGGPGPPREAPGKVFHQLEDGSPRERGGPFPGPGMATDGWWGRPAEAKAAAVCRSRGRSPLPSSDSLGRTSDFLRGEVVRPSAPPAGQDTTSAMDGGGGRPRRRPPPRAGPGAGPPRRPPPRPPGHRVPHALTESVPPPPL